jgi:hypothetical protein
MGVSCFKRELHIGLEADMSDTLATGVDAETSVRTIPALRADGLLKAVFFGILMVTSFYPIRELFTLIG